MKVALLTLQAGVPQTLATTAFVLALADGLESAGVDAQVIGLARRAAQWRPEALRPVAAAAPWIDPPLPGLQDGIRAIRVGIFDEGPTAIPSPAEDPPAWYLELLLQNELERFAGGDADLVIVLYVPVSFPTIETVACIARRRHWKLIVQSCESLNGRWMDPSVRDDYVEVVTQSADGVWTLSRFLEEYWKTRGVEPDRILVHPNVVRQHAFAAEGAPLRGEAVYLGNLLHREVDYLLQVAESVMRDVPEFRLAVYGDATDDRVHELAGTVAERGLAENVFIRPSVLPVEVPTVLRSADVLLLPRASGEFSEAGFPNKLGEYLASGRPVIVTRVGDIPTYLVDGRDAFLVEPDDCDAFSLALRMALREHDLADRVGASGKRVAEQIFASPVVAARITGFAESLTKRLSPQPVTRTVIMRRVRLIVRTLWHHVGLRTQATWAAFVNWVRYSRSGHTRVMTLKILAVQILRFLRLKPPKPGS